MKFIMSQPYINVHREIINNEQCYTETKCYINLYDKKVTTNYNQFDLKNVMDMSYKVLSGRFDFFYLHTNKGVFSFMVETSPQPFIDVFKKIT